jgi:hypothetical protein
LAPRRPISSCTVETANALARAAQRFDHHPQPGAVVHAGGVGKVIPHLLEAEIEGDRVADPHLLGYFGLVFGADVEPEILQLHHLPPLLVA